MIDQPKALVRALERRIEHAAEMKKLDAQSEAMAYARIDAFREAIELTYALSGVDPDRVSPRSEVARLRERIAELERTYDDARAVIADLREQADRRGVSLNEQLVDAVASMPAAPDPIESAEEPPADDFPAPSFDEIAF